MSKAHIFTILAILATHGDVAGTDRLPTPTSLVDEQELTATTTDNDPPALLADDITTDTLVAEEILSSPQKPTITFIESATASQKSSPESSVVPTPALQAAQAEQDLDNSEITSQSNSPEATVVTPTNTNSPAQTTHVDQDHANSELATLATSDVSHVFAGHGDVKRDWSTARVIFVDKLSDDHLNPQPGELRYALNVETGPRIVVFKIAGTIKLKKTLFIRADDSDVYVAGQTAPGAGITIRSELPSHRSDLIRIFETKNVILQHLRLRLGKGAASGTGDNLSIIDSSNIMVDHISASWSNDENIGMWASSTGKIENVTIQNSLIYEPLGPHSTNMLISSEKSWENHENIFNSIGNVRNISIHRNVFSHSSHRNPHILSVDTLIANNIIYNWKLFALGTVGSTEADFVANALIQGPASLLPNHYIYVHQSFVFDAKDPPADRYDETDPKVFYLPNGSIYHRDNTIDYLDETQPDGAFAEWDNYVEWTGLSNRFFACDGTDWRCLLNNKRETPLADNSETPYQIQDMTQSEIQNINNDAGASRRLSCDGAWIKNRDSIDARIINDQLQRIAAPTPETEADVGGYIVIEASTPCVDTDNDGMPDSFELLKGLDILSNDAFGISAETGRTNIENYLYGQ